MYPGADIKTGHLPNTLPLQQTCLLWLCYYNTYKLCQKHTCMCCKLQPWPYHEHSMFSPLLIPILQHLG